MIVIPDDQPPSERVGERDIKEFYDDSPDRGLAISLPAILDNRLTGILKAIMRPDHDVVTDLFRSGGALGNFGARIRMAYGIGLIAPETYRDLKTVSKIRNDFAHKVSIKKVDDEPVSGSNQGHARLRRIDSSVDRRAPPTSGPTPRAASPFKLPKSTGGSAPGAEVRPAGGRRRRSKRES